MTTNLFIDTTHIESVTVRITRDGKVFEKTSSSRVKKAQAVLPLVEDLLHDAQCSISDVTDVTVNDGEESYTGVRVGFAISNALGQLLHVRVNGKKTLAFPTYKPLE